MKEEKEPTTPRRVKIGTNRGLQERISADLNKVIEFANGKILPLMKLLNLPINKGAVIHYAADPEAMKADWVAALAKENTPHDATAMLREIIAEKAAARFDEVATIPGGNATTPHADLLLLEVDEDGARLYKDVEAVKEAATRYLTDPAQLEAYDRHQAAVRAMNEFFNGKAPDAWSGLREYFWLDNAGHVTAAENVDYSRFI